MSTLCIPPLDLAIGNLKHIVAQGAEFSREHNFDESVILATRLYPDMLPLIKQVQISTDMAKGAVTRLADKEPLTFADDESSFDELVQRCESTLTYINSVTDADIDGTEEKAVVVKTPRIELNFGGYSYMAKFVIPNVHFHVTTTYAIFRSIGVPLGKQDYLGPIL